MLVENKFNWISTEVIANLEIIHKIIEGLELDSNKCLSVVASASYIIEMIDKISFYLKYTKLKFIKKAL